MGKSLPVIGAALVFLLLLADLLAGGPVSTQVDPAVLRWMIDHRAAEWTVAMLAVSEVHATAGIDTMLALVVLVLVLRGSRWREALWLVLSVQGAMLMNVGIKLLLARQRPDAESALVHLQTFSFPSGHAVATTVWWGCVFMLLAPAIRTLTRRCALALTLGTFVAATCLSRVYLGAHYLSDVTAGVCEGVMWLALCRTLRSRFVPERTA